MQKTILAILLLFLAIHVFSQTNKPNGSTSSATAVAVPSAYSGSIKLNYIRTRTANAPITNLDTFNAGDYTQVKEETQYLDGLGRPLQSVARQATPGSSPKDMVSPIVYDAFGRETYKYMPYVQSGSGVANMDDGRFKLDPFSVQSGFYTGNAGLPGMNGESIFYGKTVYEASPLNRPLKAFAPGNSWAGSEGSGTEHAVSMEYRINDMYDSVRIWEIAGDSVYCGSGDAGMAVPTTVAAYAAGQLYESVTIDEHGSKVVEYRDKEGKVILKKVQIDASPYTGHTGWLCTYYVYDALAQLRFVIPPKATDYLKANSWVFNSDVTSELCFRYRYDERGRITAKKVPGSGWVYMVNDRRDRLCFTQDAKMRLANQWLTTLYDVLNRPRVTGMVTYAGCRDSLQAYTDRNFNAASYAAGGVAVHLPPIADLYINARDTGRTAYTAGQSIVFQPGFESETNAYYEAWIDTASSTENVEVHDRPLPPGSNFIALTITYYDGYAFTNKIYSTANNGKLDAGGNNFAETQPSAKSTLTKGMVTGTKVRTIENTADLSQGTWLETVTWYDDKGRPVQSLADNHKGGSNVTSTRYDFTGKPLTVYAVHSNPAANITVRQKTNMLYDHAGRLLETKKTINDNAATTRIIARNGYNMLGQLKDKLLGQKKDDNGTLTADALDTLTHDYNVRGWLKGINRDFNNGTDGRWFGMELDYDAGFDHNQFNGNVAGMKWRSKGDGERRAYGFGYDNANRLLYGDFTQHAGSNWDKSAGIDFSMRMGNGLDHATAYDQNGNIKTMWQKGLLLTTSGTIDSLNYTYLANSNKLAKVSDGITANNKLGDFTDGTNTNDDYDYDVNGNLRIDSNKHISGIGYNHLNLCDTIKMQGKGTVRYIYDAAGNKLEKIVTDTTVHPTKIMRTDYMANLVYENDTLQSLGHEEGRIRLKDTSFLYDYFIKDHLGNVRMVLTDGQKTDTYQATNEMANAGTEEQLFNKYATVDKPDGFDSDGGNAKVHRVGFVPGGSRAGPGTWGVIGEGIVLKVMAGDRVKARVHAWHSSTITEDPGSMPQPALDQLIAALFSNGVVGTATKALPGTMGSSLLLPGIQDFLTTQDNYESISGYLNWIELDEELFKPVAGSSGFEEVPRSISGEKELLEANSGDGIEIKKNGYIYVFVSNSSTGRPMFFDDLRVEHVKGALVEETHYYPFGLTMSGISSKAATNTPAQKYKYNDKELQSEEFSDGSGLEWTDFGARMYDNQIGKWMTIDPWAEKYERQSPYNGMNNNPIIFNDPTGKGGELTVETDENGKLYLKVTAKIYVYSYQMDKKSVDKYAAKIKSDIVSQWGNPTETDENGKPLDESAKAGGNNNGSMLNVVFDVSVEAVTTDQAEALAKDNKSASVNFVGLVNDDRVSEVMDGNNSAIMNVKELDNRGSTTAAHEFGHMLGYDVKKGNLNKDGTKDGIAINQNDNDHHAWRQSEPYYIMSRSFTVDASKRRVDPIEYGRLNGGKGLTIKNSRTPVLIVHPDQPITNTLYK